MGLIADAVLGAVLGGLLQAIIAAKEKAVFFKRTLEHLEATLNEVYPIVIEILKSENVTNDTCIRFKEQLEKAKVLVEMYSDIKKWKLLKKRKVKTLIKEMDASLQRFLSRDFQAEQLRYLAVIDKDVGEMNKKMDHIITLLEKSKGNETIKGHETNPETTDEETSPPSSPEAASGSKPSKTSFELHWKFSTDKCLDIRLWRHHE